jgi:glc operon protein GlcG
MEQTMKLFVSVGRMRFLPFSAALLAVTMSAGSFAQTDGRSTPAANISLEQAERVVAAAIAYARKNDKAMAVVVVDSGGHVVTGSRMSGVPFGTFDVARGKAIASVATGGESGRALMERYKANPIVFGQISALHYGGPMFPSQGSLPIFQDGMLIGAVAGSGASSQFDEDAARVGLAAIGAKESR